MKFMHDLIVYPRSQPVRHSFAVGQVRTRGLIFVWFSGEEGNDNYGALFAAEETG
jgi:hypothetical protein